MHPKLDQWVHAPSGKLNPLQHAVCHLWLNENNGPEYSPLANMAASDYEAILEALRQAEGLLNMPQVITLGQNRCSETGG